jgi:hypothetical protein
MTEVALGGGLIGRRGVLDPGTAGTAGGIKGGGNTSNSLWSDQVSDDHKTRRAANFARQVKFDVTFQ